MLNICLTADHELFFGQNYASEKEIIIAPTYRLMDVVEKYNIPLCLFTDVCSIKRYRELDINSTYVSMMEEQLKYAINRGHDVQLHIHPHWLTSEYQDGKWNFDSSRYTLHSYGFNGDSVLNGQQIIVEGKQYLEKLLMPVDEEYQCIAFRAGGWCLQPEKDFLKALTLAGLLIDATVYYGGYRKNGIHNFDFRHVPNKPNWWINPDRGLVYEAGGADGNLFEVATGSYGMKGRTSIKKIIHKVYKWKLKYNSSLTLGIGIDNMAKRSKVAQVMDKLKNFVFQPIMFSFDGACKEVMIDVMVHYLKRFDCCNKDYYLCIIGHPKTLRDTDLVEINQFCETVLLKFNNSVKFIRFRDIPLKYLK